MSKQNLSTSSSEAGGIRRVLIKFTAFFVLLTAFFFGCVAPQYSNEYTGSLMDKTDRLKSIDTPKIVLIGNSNLSFGIRSALIGETMDMEVVNMGLHGGLGNAFHEEMARVNVGPGDIVVVCHTNYYDDGSVVDEALAWITVENHFSLWRLVPKDQWYQMALALPTYVKKCTALFLHGEGNRIPAGCYARTAFNEYGDNVYCAANPDTYDFPEDYYPVAPAVNDICTARLNRLNQYIRDRGASLVIAGYPIACDEKTDAETLAGYQADFETFQTELASRVDCPVISDFRDYFYPYSYFYNGDMHLTEEGAVLRTEQLIRDLQKYMETRAS